jgi:sugar lactone lactonase YvrE
MNKITFRNLALFTLVFLSFLTAQASEPTVWQVNTRNEVLRGDSRGVSITETGAIVLAPRLAEVFNTQQSFVWSSAVDAAGNVYLGTGSDGRLFKVDATGKGALFADFTELDVTALAVARDGALFAATSPDGKVYRVAADGKAEVYFDPADKYIWSLTLTTDGNLIVGTGENGKIYRVRGANAAADSSLLFDSSETHIISLTVDRAGNVIAGTDANGVVLRVSPEGRAFALLDAPAPLREIHEVSVAPDGSVYALALSDSASASNTAGTTVTSPTSGATVTVSAVSVAEDPSNPGQPAAPPRSRNDLSNTKSAVFRIAPDGGNEVVWSSTTVTAFALHAPQTGSVLVGTSEKGRIYSITNDGRETLLLQTNEGQVSNIVSSGNNLFATSSNGGKLYNFGGGTLGEGSYESVVRDAKSSALWGRIWWRGAGNIELQTRTGNTERPDATWSDWSAVYANAAGAQIASPKARFLQWRAVLKGSSGAAVLNEVNVSYLPQNIAPEVLRVEVLPTNVGLQANPPPPTDPNIETSGLDPTAFGLPPQQNIPPRRLYQRGARGLQWTAEDRNGDKLEYAVYYRGVTEQTFRLLKDGLRDNFYTIDGAALSDGSYVFRVVATDAPSNPLGNILTGERISETIEIDNTAPLVSAASAAQVVGERVRVTFDATDAGSGLRRAEVSINGRDWQAIYADDGISDSRAERYTVDVPVAAGENTISLRAFDANGNFGSFRVTARR